MGRMRDVPRFSYFGSARSALPFQLVGALLAAACGDSADTPAADAASTDAALVDASVDANLPQDAAAEAAVDAGCAPFAMPSDCTIPPNSALPSELSCTGLYQNFGARTLACGVRGYVPAYQLWSDGAAKQRYVFLPEGKKLDGSDPNGIVYPEGTKFWKEFRGAGERLLETRLLQKTNAGWVFTSYVWDETGTHATQNNDGVSDLFGTGHTVPNRDQCDECHTGRDDKILGWDSFMLGKGSEGLTREELIRLGLFAAGKELPAHNVPGDDVERAALGYLHANCGISCHNASTLAKARDTGLMLRLEADTTSAPGAPAFTSALQRVPGDNAKLGGLTAPGGMALRSYYRDLVPQDLARSLLLVRMQKRGIEAQMPQIATNRVDDAGVAVVSEWIKTMTVQRGYSQDAGLQP